MSDDLPAIFIIINGGGGDTLVGCALAEDGRALAGHLSSSEGWVRHDMGLTSDWKHASYAAHYPHGYRLVDLVGVDPTIDAGCREAVERNKTLQALELVK